MECIVKNNISCGALKPLENDKTFELINDGEQLHVIKNINIETDLIELDILSRLYHPNIIHHTKISDSISSTILSVELPLVDRTLTDLLKNKYLSTQVKLPIMYKLSHALKFLHKNNIVHKNLTIENVLLRGFNNYEPYLTGFENSNESTNQDDKYIDIWAFGILCLNIITNNNITNDKIIFSLPTLLNGVSQKYYDNLLDLLFNIFKLEPCDRLTAKQIHNHPLFDEFRENVIDNYIIKELTICEYADDHRDILKLLIHWTKNIYKCYDISLLFLAIDLFSRTDNYYKDNDSNQRMYVAATCLYISSKFFETTISLCDFVSNISNDIPSINNNDVINYELKIVKLLNGVLNVSLYYKSCDNIDQLMLTFDNIIMSRDSTLYCKTDIIKWINIMELYIGTPFVNNKKITIDKFLNG